MNKHNAPADLNPPQPLRRPAPLNHFPYPTPHITINAATSPVTRSTLVLKENWN